VAGSFGQGAVYVTASSVLFVLSGYLINVWLGRHLGPADYGVFGVVVTLMTVLNVVQSAGVPQAVARYAAEQEEHSNPVLRSGLILQVVIAVALSLPFLVAAEPLAALLADPSIAPYLRATSLVFVPHGLLTLYLGYYNGLRLYGRHALMMAVYSVGKAAATIGLVYVLHLYGAIAGYVVAPLAALLLGVRLPSPGGVTFSYRRLVAFALPVVAFLLIVSLQISLDLFFVKASIADDAAAGYYTASQNIARIPYYALSGLGLVLAPAVARHMTWNLAEEAANLLRHSLRFALIAVVPTATLIAATSGSLLELLYSERYLPGAEALSVLSVGMAFITLFTVLAGALNGLDRPWVAVLVAAAGLTTTGVLCFLAVPWLGVSGAAFGTTLGALVALAGAALTLHRRFGRLVSIGLLGRVGAASSVMFLVARGVRPPAFVLPLAVPAFLSLYLGMLIALGEFKRADWDRLRRVFPLGLQR